MANNTPILITGGAGYIGSHVVLALLDSNIPVVVIDDLSTGQRDLIPDGVPFVKGHIGDTDLINKTLNEYNCKSVMHFAGSIINPESFKIPLSYYSNNTSASCDLIKACVHKGVENFVFSSSASVYGEPENIPISESEPTNPISPYGRSKLMTEWMLSDAAIASPMKVALLRYFNVAGADPEGRSGQVGPPTHLIKIATEAALGYRRGVSIFGDDFNTSDGTCLRDYIHVTDLADAHLLALKHLMEDGKSIVLNCGYGHGHSVKEIIKAVEKVASASIETTIAPRRIGDAAVLVADNSKMLSLLSWSPNFDNIELMIRTALDWEKR